MRRDAERPFLAQGVLGGFLRGTELVRLFAEHAAGRLERILKDRTDSRWRPFVPNRTTIASYSSLGKYLTKHDHDLYVAAWIGGSCLGRRINVTLGFWQVPDLVNDGRVVLYLHADEAKKSRSLPIPCKPTDGRVRVHDEVYLCLVPSKNVDLPQDFGILLAELREMLPRMLGKAA
jgi:hypothetical protein